MELDVVNGSGTWSGPWPTAWANATEPAPPPAPPAWRSVWDAGRVQIPLYSAIFLLAVSGNGLVILTLAVDRRMRSITNVFLLNLAVSDLLLGVLCMPFTLVGALLRDFIFGAIMCRLIPYLQACSVAVSAWTLVAISVERYYAICHPLRSHKKTVSHAYHMIVIIWSVSLASMAPIALLSELKPTNQGHHKCRESWPDPDYERMYNILLDMLLLVLPLVVLTATYSLITSTLRQGTRFEHARPPEDVHLEAWRPDGPALAAPAPAARAPDTCRPAAPVTDGTLGSLDNGQVSMYVAAKGSRPAVGVGSGEDSIRSGRAAAAGARSQGDSAPCQPRAVSRTSSLPAPKPSFRAQRLSFRAKPSSLRAQPPPSTVLRRSDAERLLRKNKRVIKMLCAVVLEFFVCWTPLYVINTVALFTPAAVYSGLGYTAISFFQLLAYSSSCCNPITYCFMNSSFRNSFLTLFRCRRPLLSKGFSNASVSKHATRWDK